MPSTFGSLNQSPATFSGLLPCLETFPQVMLPQMSLAYRPGSEVLFAILESAWRENGWLFVMSGCHEKPLAGTSHEIGTLTRVTALDVRSRVVMLSGQHRARRTDIHSQVGTLAQVQGLADVYPASESGNRRLRRDLLMSVLEERHPLLAQQDMLSPLFDAEYPLGMFCDLLAHAVRLSQPDQMSILHEVNVDRRCDLLIRFLKQSPQTRQEFPPCTSTN